MTIRSNSSAIKALFKTPDNEGGQDKTESNENTDTKSYRPGL